MNRLRIVIFAVVFAPTAASADIASLYGQVQSGGAGGSGLGGDALVKDNSFHEKTEGLTYGAVVGIEFLFIDVWAEHNQYIGTDGDFLGTWTQLMAGLDLHKGLGQKNGARLDRDQGKMVGGYDSGYIEAGIAIGLGMGTLQQVDPPLNNEQIDDKGPVGQAHVGLGYNLTRILSIGVAAPVQVGYLFKSGVANDLSNQYSSVQYAVVANLRMKFQLK